MKIIQDLRWLNKEWTRNYRHSGGFSALARCVKGSMSLYRTPGLLPEQIDGLSVDALTFSVVPGMTALWALLMGQVLSEQSSSARILIGDCSGAFEAPANNVQTRVFPMLNALHGIKLDLFMQNICRAKFVIVSDDDVFWLNSYPWQWALQQFAADPKTAVVSLIPRSYKSVLLRGKVDTPMGSHCLVINRETWQKENLSFKIVYPPESQDKLYRYEYRYDTADYANVQLLERGYNIAIAPPEIRRHFVTLDGISSWTLKIQEKGGNINDQIVSDPILRAEKALRTVHALSNLSGLYERHFKPAQSQGFPSRSVLRAAAEVCARYLTGEQQDAIQADIRLQVDTLAACLV